ncbi:LPS-assembly protein LptD [Variovorax rhizosphaerae]|uniref:LPS-assembly protein LptD n=1 Tax=Variovorax rhizosphaerae TaxID=1836200 RepID=A0ABU8WCT1_9BURK
MPTPDLTRAPRRRCRPPLPLAVLSLALLHAHGASAQTFDLAGPLILKRTPQLQETVPPALRGDQSSFVSGERISGQPDLQTEVTGDAQLRRGDMVINAEKLSYEHPADLAKATGHVRVNQAGNEYSGPDLELKVESFEGFFNNVRYRFLATGGHGDAQRIDFVDQSRSVAREATYTTCRREDYPGWVPAWMLSATTLHTDTEENVGVAENAQLSFMGIISTPPFPSLSFPLNSNRKTGLLPPTLGIDNVNGFEIVQPWYWNLAPNRDITLTPTFMSKRGLNLSTDFRYLEQGYNGEARVDYMPDDTLRDRERWGIWTSHAQIFDPKPLGLDSLRGTLNINRVSDDDYWRDFARTPSLTTRLLANDGTLNWAKGDWTGQARALYYQTLQDTTTTSKLVPPYNRMPQVTADYNKYDWNGFDITLNNDFTRFDSNPLLQYQKYQYVAAPNQPSVLLTQPNAERVYSQASISRPFLTPGTFVVPKLLLNARAYSFDDPLSVRSDAQAYQKMNGVSSANVTVPTFSLDGGLVFERDTNFFGRALVQTLEPRAFYVYTPYRDQSAIPVYDTAANDFNFATVYTENAYSGNDRIADNNLLTLGVTSRLIDADTGEEAARFGIAQRLRFSDQRVQLPTVPTVEKGVGDVLMGAQINWTPKWSLDTTIQYNPDTHTSTRNTLGLRYSPGPYRSITAAYRYQADSTPGAGDGNKSFDIGWQWPLNDLWGTKDENVGLGRGLGGGRWYAVGRLNYSLVDRKMTDGIVGLEYDGCCYIGRIVLERLTTGQVTANTRIMFQIEFVGFTSVGTSPLRTLQTNIPRYTPLRQPVPGPSRYTNYD